MPDEMRHASGSLTRRSHAGGHRSVSTSMLAAEACLAVALVFTPLALGGALRWVSVPLTALSLAACAFALRGAARQRQPFALPLLAAVPGLGALLCLLQLVPLPPPLLKLLSAPAAELRDFALVPLGLTGWRPISMDPSGTWLELAKHLAYFGLMLAAVQVARSRSARRRLFVYAAGTSAAVAFVGLLHELAGAEKLLGLYAFSTRPTVLSTFGNPNHLAGYCGLGATLALGLVLSERTPALRLAWAGAYGLSGLTVFFSLSRGGMAFFVGGQLLFVALLLLVRRQKLPDRKSGRTALVAALGVAAVLLLAAYVAYDQIAGELSTASSIEKLRRSKIELWPMLASSARPFSAAGMGRGAFALAFTRFQTKQPDVTFTHPENWVLQLWAELGVVGLLALGGLSLVAFLRLLHRDELGPTDLAVVAGGSALLLHNLFDFSLELPAAASTLAVLLGILSRPSDEVSAFEAGRAGWPCLGAAGLLAALGLWLGRHDALEAERALESAIRARTPLQKLRESGIALVDRHPADYALYQLLAQAHARTDPREALAFANRALFLRPLDSESHRAAARALLRLGQRRQALLEYRLAFESSLSGGSVLEESIRVAKDADEAMRVVPAKPLTRHLAYVKLLELERHADARSLLESSLEELGSDREAAVLFTAAASAYLSEGQKARALERIEKAIALSPGEPGPIVFRASILAQMGKRDEAIEALEAESVKRPDHVSVALELARQLLAAGRTAKSREALKRAKPFISAPSDRVSVLLLEAQTYEAEGRLVLALQAYQTAARMQPFPAYHYRIAQTYEQLGKYREAVSAVHEGLRLDRPEAAEKQRAWLERLEERARSVAEQAEQRALEPGEPAPDEPPEP